MQLHFTLRQTDSRAAPAKAAKPTAVGEQGIEGAAAVHGGVGPVRTKTSEAVHAGNGRVEMPKIGSKIGGITAGLSSR